MDEESKTLTGVDHPDSSASARTADAAGSEPFAQINFPAFSGPNSDAPVAQHAFRRRDLRGLGQQSGDGFPNLRNISTPALSGPNAVDKRFNAHALLDAHSTAPESPAASFERDGTGRAELLEQLRATQGTMEAQVAELRTANAEPSLIAECSEQISMLADLQRNIATAAPTTLSAIRADVAASIAAVANIAGRAREATLAAATASAQLAATTAATRQHATTLAADLYERRIFDPYLKFASEAEEVLYRQREADSRRYIEEQLAKDTPTGTLNATGALAGQMLDAHAHGAGDSPDFASRWQRVTSAIESQRQIVQAQGLSTDEFDRNLAASVRRYLKSKGLSDEEITARLAADADPLNAVKPYMRSEEDAKALSAAVRNHESPKAGSAAATNIPKENVVGAAAVQLDSVVASLRSAGATAAIDPQTQCHGLTVDRSQRTSTEQSPG